MKVKCLFGSQLLYGRSRCESSSLDAYNIFTTKRASKREAFLKKQPDEFTKESFCRLANNDCSVFSLSFGFLLPKKLQEPKVVVAFVCLVMVSRHDDLSYEENYCMLCCCFLLVCMVEAGRSYQYESCGSYKRSLCHRPFALSNYLVIRSLSTLFLYYS